MWSTIKILLSPYLRQIILGGVIAAALWAIWGLTYRAGEKAEKVNTLVKQERTVRKVHAIQDKNRATLHDGDAVKRLQQFWSRD